MTATTSAAFEREVNAGAVARSAPTNVLVVGVGGQDLITLLQLDIATPPQVKVDLLRYADLGALTPGQTINQVRLTALHARIEDTVNYKELKDRIVAELSDTSYELIESVARHVCELCLACDGVQRVTVCVDKPGALTGARSVAVELTRDA